MRLVYALAVSGMVVLISAGRGLGQEGTGSTAPPPSDEGKRVVAAIGADGIQHVQMVGGEYYFDPNDIVVKVNTPVELSVKKSADASFFIPHDLFAHAPEAGIDISLHLKSDSQSVTFTPTKTGKYEFYCDKKSPFGKTHKERGMEGHIEVVE